MRHWLRSFRTFALAAAAAAPLTLGAADAHACGGFFCSASPVDQTAERILFTINDDGTVTAVVQIKYVGDRDEFAWIVPVPGNPTLAADFPDQALRALDMATQPQYFKNSCNRGVAFGGDAGLAVPAAADGSGVTVVASQVVGPFETVTLNATSADVLIAWLQKNDYRLTDAMVPLLQPYVEGGMNFVAVRLQADRQVEDIRPLMMTYEGDRPVIPIRLTAIAAQPEMGIVTWILDDRRWAPSNYVDLKIPDQLIEFDQYGYQSNYLTVVSREADKVGGEAFVTEYAKPTAELAQQMAGQFAPTPEGEAARDTLVALLQKYPYMTRLYARMSAEEMIDDPIFQVATDQSDVDNVHDLTEPNFDWAQCSWNPNTTTDPCAFTYCGRSGVCVPTSVTLNGATTQVAACVCAADATARTTTTGAQPDSYCEPVAMNLDTGTTGSAAPPAACEAFDCGAHGACVPMNGNPTCQCEAGYGAVTSQIYDGVTGTYSMQIRCEQVLGPIPALPVLPKAGQTTIPAGGSGSGMASDDGGCSITGGGPGRAPLGGGASVLAGLAALVAGLRRRDRRS